MGLERITEPIGNELEEFREYFRNAMKSKIAFVDFIARYLVKQKGKKIRPTLVLLTAKACGGINEHSFRGASLVEILHTATLIHDDVIDDADTRRGLASINAVWKNKIAVLMGDYLLAKGLLISLDNDEFKFLKIISDAVRRMSEAEILQTAKIRRLDINEKTYLQIISDKTASLLSTCCQIGATSATNDQDILRAMKDYGENVGMVFQLRDDMLDYVGRKSITGKPTGLDVKGKKLTLPLIYSMEKAPSSQGKQILRIIKNGATRRELESVVEFAHEFGGIDYTRRKAAEYSERAVSALQRLDATPAKISLGDFVSFVMEREK
jgi:octaprenyl-diphosphate synthase